jgi:hypothetical protein
MVDIQTGHIGLHVASHVAGGYVRDIETVPHPHLHLAGEIAQSLGSKQRHCLVLLTAVQVRVLWAQAIFTMHT